VEAGALLLLLTQRAAVQQATCALAQHCACPGLTVVCPPRAAEYSAFMRLSSGGRLAASYGGRPDWNAAYSCAPCMRKEWQAYSRSDDHPAQHPGEAGLMHGAAHPRVDQLGQQVAQTVLHGSPHAPPGCRGVGAALHLKQGWVMVRPNVHSSCSLAQDNQRAVVKSCCAALRSHQQRGHQVVERHRQLGRFQLPPEQGHLQEGNRAVTLRR